MEFPQISVNVDSKTIIGKIIYHSQRDIDVEITNPYTDVRRGLHSPYFSPILFVGEHSDLTALSLLTSIYEICEFAKNNKEILLENLEITNKEIGVINEEINTLNREKLTLKSTFKNNEITNIEYQQELTNIKRKIKYLDFKISGYWSKYFELFPMIVPHGTRDDILKLIEKI